MIQRRRRQHHQKHDIESLDGEDRVHGKQRSKRKKYSRYVQCILVIFAFYYAMKRLFKRPPPPIPPEIIKKPINIPKDHKVSVVIMNHNRPHMIQQSKLLPTLLEHESIDQILLCHSNADTKFEYKHPKVTNIDAIEANRDYGLSLRFHFCRQARNDWVIQVDDDQEMSKQAIDELITEFNDNPHRIVGRYGRQYDYWNYIIRNGYNTYTYLGPVEVVLTKFMIHEKLLCGKFFEYAGVVEDFVPYSKPKWNAEDIFMSLTANHVYNVPPEGPFNNFAMPLDIWEASDKYEEQGFGTHGASISGNMDRIKNAGTIELLSTFWRATLHCRYRGSLWYHAKQRLASLEI